MSINIYKNPNLRAWVGFRIGSRNAKQSVPKGSTTYFIAVILK